MAEFNPDGSIKLPGRILKQKKSHEFRMKNGLCVTIKKEIINDKSPKKCALSIQLSEKFNDNSFVARVYSEFMNYSEVPSKLSKENDKEFKVEIGTCFSRCKDCTNLVNKFRGFLEGNIIEEKGSCTYEKKGNVFCYEDYFD